MKHNGVSNIMKAWLKDCVPYGVVKKFGQEDRTIIDIPKGTALPQIYSAQGEEVLWIYLQDEESCHHPHSLSPGRVSDRIIWDRFDYGIDKHLYINDEIYHTVGKPGKKYAFLKGCKDIHPEIFEHWARDIDYLREFDVVFTNQNYFLETLSNARFLPPYGTWYGTEIGGGIVNSGQYKCKCKNISMVASYKNMTELHRIRKNLAIRLSKGNVVDCYGNFDGRPGCKCEAYLRDYRFSIAFENQITDYYFTEKITNCFLAQTIPVYIGAPNIGDLFNNDGIICVDIKDIDNLDTILAGLTEEEYMNRLDAVKDNFQRVQKYLSPEIYMLSEYSDLYV